jgi:hypothetical protein
LKYYSYPDSCCLKNVLELSLKVDIDSSTYFPVPSNVEDLDIHCSSKNNNLHVRPNILTVNATYNKQFNDVKLFCDPSFPGKLILQLPKDDYCIPNFTCNAKSTQIEFVADSYDCLSCFRNVKIPKNFVFRVSVRDKIRNVRLPESTTIKYFEDLIWMSPRGIDNQQRLENPQESENRKPWHQQPLVQEPRDQKPRSEPKPWHQKPLVQEPRDQEPRDQEPRDQEPRRESKPWHQQPLVQEPRDQEPRREPKPWHQKPLVQEPRREPKPWHQKPLVQEPSDQEPSDQEPSDQEPSDQKPRREPKPWHQQPLVQEPRDQKPSDQKPSDPKARREPKPWDQKPSKK